MNSPVFLEQRAPGLSPCPYRQFGSHRWSLPIQEGLVPQAISPHSGLDSRMFCAGGSSPLHTHFPSEDTEAQSG